VASFKSKHLYRRVGVAVLTVAACVVMALDMTFRFHDDPALTPASAAQSSSTDEDDIEQLKVRAIILQ